MLIEDYYHLNDSQVKEIRALEDICNQYEKLKAELSFDVSFNFDSSLKSFFLLYSDNVLSGFLSIFAPGKGEAEISAYTHPEFRRRGFFKALLAKASAELERHNVTELLFLCDSRSRSGKKAYEALRAKYDFTENTLSLLLPCSKVQPKQQTGIRLRKAAYDDLQVLAAVDAFIFNTGIEISIEMIKKTMSREDREQYVAVLGERIIGMCSVFYQGKRATIFGVGILPQFQGKGYGRELMKSIIGIISSGETDEIQLDVNSSNKKAYNLYTSLGFRAKSSVDYYKTSIPDLKLNEITGMV